MVCYPTLRNDGPNEQTKPPLVKIMAWRQTDSKPLSKAILYIVVSTIGNKFESIFSAEMVAILFRSLYDIGGVVLVD